MGEFLQNNWIWIVIVGFFILMHGFGMGCGGHGAHGRHRERDDDGERNDKTGRRGEPSALKVKQ